MSIKEGSVRSRATYHGPIFIDIIWLNELEIVVSKKKLDPYFCIQKCHNTVENKAEQLKVVTKKSDMVFIYI